MITFENSKWFKNLSIKKPAKGSPDEDFENYYSSDELQTAQTEYYDYHLDNICEIIQKKYEFTDKQMQDLVDMLFENWDARTCIDSMINYHEEIDELVLIYHEQLSDENKGSLVVWSKNK